MMQALKMHTAIKYWVHVWFLVLATVSKQGDALTCLSCTRAKGQPLCKTMVECSKMEGCYVSEFNDVNSTTLYTSGCATNNECHATLPETFGKRDIAGKKVLCCRYNLCNQDASTIQPHEAEAKEFGAAGKDFILAFGTNFYPFATVALQLLIVSRKARKGVIRIPHLQVSETIQLSPGLTTYNVSSAILPDDLDIKDKGIRVTTDQPVTLFAMNLGRSSSDGFYVFPLSSLSSRYHLLTSMPYVNNRGHFQSEAVVVSPSNDNQITFNLRFSSGNLTYEGQTYNSGDRMAIDMNALDVFQFYEIGQITGTLVQSSQPLAAFSGNRCNVFEDGPGCDHFFEMIPPLSCTDNEFIVPKFRDHCNGTLQITATENDTVVKISSQSTSTLNLQEGQYHERLILGATVISASKNVHVTMFPHGANDTNHFDPFMITIPGINRYLSEYDIAVPRFDYANYIAIVVRQRDIHNMRIDNGVLKNNLDMQHVEIKGEEYAVFSHTIADGAHTVHNIKNKLFGLMVYGNKIHDSYGFLGGLNTK